MRAPLLPIYTIGHSSRPLDAFLALLAESRIECVVDVRRLPGSRTFPHFDTDALSASLAAVHIDYWYLPSLCGRRSQGELDGRAREDFWTNASFARYAAWARGAEFTAGLDALMQRAAGASCAIMCAEAVWWRCHRRIIADHLLAHGCQVIHILGEGNTAPASLTRGACVRGGVVVYPAPVDDAE